MSIVYNSAVKDARMNVVLDAIDVGTAGSIELLDSGDVLLASAPLNLPSFIEASQALTMITSPTVQCQAPPPVVSRRKRKSKVRQEP